MSPPPRLGGVEWLEKSKIKLSQLSTKLKLKLKLKLSLAITENTVCNICDLKAKTTGGLKTHVTKKYR